MKHIDTKSKIEKKADADFPIAKVGTKKLPSDKCWADIDKLIDLTRQVDDLTLQINNLKGKVKAEMGDAESLVDKDGELVISWKNGNIKKSVDWDGIRIEMNIPDSVIKKYTTEKRGGRIFSINT